MGLTVSEKSYLTPLPARLHKIADRQRNLSQAPIMPAQKSAAVKTAKILEGIASQIEILLEAEAEGRLI